MSSIVFCKTRTQDTAYDSYRDFFTLVELAGYPLIYVDEIDPMGDDTYIITPINGEWQHGWSNPRARIILWQMEWDLDGTFTAPPGVHEVWCSDGWQARQLNARYVPMGSDARLACAGDGEWQDEYDAAYIGYMIPRREQMTVYLRAAGVRLSPPHGWGKDRHQLLRQSRAYLHVHQWDHIATLPPLRLAVAAAYELPFISEGVQDRGIFGYSNLLMSDYNHLPAFVRLWTQDERNLSRLRDYGLSLYQTLCVERPFRRCVEEAL